MKEFINLQLISDPNHEQTAQNLKYRLFNAKWGVQSFI